MVVATHAAPVKPAAKPKPKVIRIDSTVLKTRAFNNDALQQYNQQKEFQYDETKPVQGLSWWDRFWGWLWRSIGHILGKIRMGKTSWLLFRIGLFVLAGGVITFIIFKVLGIDIVKLFRGESKNVDIPYQESLENIHDINFDNEIEQAVNNRNYRIAVRLLYLRSLKQLSDAGLIHWQLEKTNASYLNELNDTQYHQLFGLLTTQFEYIWYGDFPIDGQSFQNINALFNDLKKRLP